MVKEWGKMKKEWRKKKFLKKKRRKVRRIKARVEQEGYGSNVMTV